MNDTMFAPIMEAVMVPKDQYHDIVNYSESHADFRTFLPNASFTDYAHSCEMMERFIQDGICAISSKGYSNDKISLATQKFVCESAELWKTQDVYVNRILRFMESTYRVPEKMKSVREKAIAEHPEYSDIVNYMVTKYLEEYAVRASNEMSYIVEYVQMKNDLPLLMEMNSLVSNGYYLPEGFASTMAKIPGMIIQMVRRLMNGLNYTLTETSKRFASRILTNNQINEDAIKRIYQIYQAKGATGNQPPIMYPDPKIVNEKRKAYATGFDEFVRQMTDAVSKKNFSGVDDGVVQMIQNFNVVASNKTLPKNASFEEFRTAILSIANNILLMEGLMSALTKINDAIIEYSGIKPDELDNELGAATYKAKQDEVANQQQANASVEMIGQGEYLTEKSTAKPKSAETTTGQDAASGTTTGGSASDATNSGTAASNDGEGAKKEPEKKEEEPASGALMEKFKQGVTNFIDALTTMILGDGDNSLQLRGVIDGAVQGKIKDIIDSDKKNPVQSLLAFFHITNDGSMDREAVDSDALEGMMRSMQLDPLVEVDKVLTKLFNGLRKLFGMEEIPVEDLGKLVKIQQSAQNMNASVIPIMEADGDQQPAKGQTQEDGTSGENPSKIKQAAQSIENAATGVANGIKTAATIISTLAKANSIRNDIARANMNNWKSTILKVTAKTVGYTQVIRDAKKIYGYVKNKQWDEFLKDKDILLLVKCTVGVTAITFAQIYITEQGGINEIWRRSQGDLPAPKRAMENLATARSNVPPIASNLWNRWDASVRNLWTFTNNWLYGGVKVGNTLSQKTVGIAEIIRQEIASLSSYVNLKDVITFEKDLGTRNNQH